MIEFAPGLPEVKKEKYFILENWLIDTNALCMLHTQSLLLYLLLVRKAKHRKGYIYTDQINSGTNINRTHISRYIKQLETFRLITITKRSKRLKYYRYNINTKEYIYKYIGTATERQIKDPTYKQQ